jgi:hypothetical protein
MTLPGTPALRAGFSSLFSPRGDRRPAGLSPCTRSLPLTVFLVASLLLPACVSRKIRVTSEPPGATVWLNDVEIGQTPAEADFFFYGRYDIRLELEGHEPLWTNRRADSPVHEWPGIDLVAEALPLRFDNTVEWHFVLEPALESAAEPESLRADLIHRANELRDRARE